MATETAKFCTLGGGMVGGGGEALLHVQFKRLTRRSAPQYVGVVTKREKQKRSSKKNVRVDSVVEVLVNTLLTTRTEL
jgi:hypothetical protein